MCAAVLTALVLAGAGCKPGAAKEAGPPGGAAKPAAPVRIAAVTERAMPVQVPAPGAVQPIHSVQVRAQVSGVMTDVLFNEGDVVTPGQLLFVIDKRPYEVALRQAKANLAKAQAMLQQAKATVSRDKAQALNANAILEREQQLLGKGMTSQEKFDQAKANADAAQAAVAADEAGIRSAAETLAVSSAEVDQAQLWLDYCEIKSPLDGQTGTVASKKGNLVALNDGAALVTINQIKPIYVAFAVSERYLPDIQRYQAQSPLSVQAIIPEDDQGPLTGKLTFIDNTVDTSAGSIAMKATFANEDNRLWPGQYVRVIVEVTAQANAVVAPAAAILNGQQGPYTYVVNADMKAEMRKVATGQTVDGFTVVREGLEPDEKVVTEGQLRLTDGATVAIATDELKGEGPAS
jgi:multidrug efflux system membrane fusion protein